MSSRKEKPWSTILQYAGQMGVQPSGPPFVAYYNLDMQDLDLEIGFPYTPSGVAYEFYLNDPRSTPAAELQTQVVFPLRSWYARRGSQPGGSLQPTSRRAGVRRLFSPAG